MFEMDIRAMVDKAINPSEQGGFVRRQDWFDSLVAEADVALGVLAGVARAARPSPAKQHLVDDVASRPTDSRHAAGLMRINHVGEVCAQALYRGQALVCSDQAIATVFRQAAVEETDHLVWCDERLKELGSRPSLLNPIWYAGSFALGLLAGRAGVRQNLGFMAETERQVEAHLDDHLVRLPSNDLRSRAIVSQMKVDEAGHRIVAENQGAQELPVLIRTGMRLMARIMTATAYRV